MFGGDDVGKFGRWPDDAVGEMCPSSCRLASVTPLACIAASETRSDRFASDFRKKKKGKQGQGVREGLEIGDDAGRNTYTSGSESSVMRLLATLLWSPSDSSLWKRGSSSGVLMMGMSGMGGTF